MKKEKNYFGTFFQGHYFLKFSVGTGLYFCVCYCYNVGIAGKSSVLVTKVSEWKTGSPSIYCLCNMDIRQTRIVVSMRRDESCVCHLVHLA